MPRYYKRQRTSYARRYKRWTPRTSGYTSRFRRSGIYDDEKWKRAVRRLGVPQTQGGGYIKVRTGGKPIPGLSKGKAIPSISFGAALRKSTNRILPTGVSSKFVDDPRIKMKLLGQVGTTKDGTPIIDPDLNPRFQTTSDMIDADPISSLIEAGRGALGSLFATPIGGGFAVNAVRRMFTPNSLKTVGRVGALIGNKTMARAGRMGEFRKIGGSSPTDLSRTPSSFKIYSKIQDTPPTKVNRSLINEFTAQSPGLRQRTPVKTARNKVPDQINKYFALKK